MLKFIKEFIRSPKSIGAISPSSKFLANKMIGSIEFERCNCIIEYGAGTGVFTKEVILRKRESTIFIVFEKNNEFAEILKNKYLLKKNVKIINDSVENIYIYLTKYKIKEVDYIISGLPFASLPNILSDNILEKTKEIITKSNGTFITFQYSLIKIDMFNRYFERIKYIKEYFNIPPAYIIICNNYI
ncbi:MAG: class I SAM-dependent methyltransferase [Clostridium sp.]